MIYWSVADNQPALNIYKSASLEIYTYSEDCVEIDALQFLDSIELSRFNHSSFVTISSLLNWDSFVVWKCGKNKIKVGCSLGGGFSYFAVEENHVTISKSESHLINKFRSKLNYEIARDCLKVKNRILFSCSSFLNQEYFKNIIVPGMYAEINVESGEINEGWHLNISDFCTISSQSLADKLPQAIHDVIKLISSNISLPSTLMLSSGIDSALIAGALYSLGEKASSNFCCVNFCPSPYQHESIQAEYLAKNLNLSLVSLPEYGQATQTRRGYSHLDPYFASFEKMHGFCHMTQVLCNMDMAAVPYFGYHNSIGGTTGPTNLQIKHHLNYNTLMETISPEAKKNIEGAMNARKTFQCKSEFRISFDCESSFNESNRILGVYSYISSRVSNLKFLWPENGKSFSVDSDALINSNIAFILSKIKSSKFIRELDKTKYDSLTAQKILKIFTMFANHTRTNTSFRTYSLTKVKNPIEPLMCSKITSLFLQTKIDSALVEHAKWPLFHAFEKLTGMSFSKLYRESLVLKGKMMINRDIKDVDNALGRYHPFTQMALYKHLTSRYKAEFSYLKETNIVNTSLENELNNHPPGLPLFRQLEKMISLARMLY